MRSAEERVASPTEVIDLGGMESSLGFLLRIAQIKVFERFFTEFSSCGGLVPGEFAVLWVIHVNTAVRQGVLAEAIRIKPAHMTKTVRRLEGMRLVRRLIPENDRRSVVLSLTHEGEQLVSRFGQAFFRAESVLADRLSREELTTLIALLQRIAA